MNNLLPAHYAKINTQNRLEEIKQTESYNKYIDIIYQEIRKASNLGRLAVEIKLAHPLIGNFPLDSISMLLGVELTSNGYNVKYGMTGKLKRENTIQIFWGLPEENNLNGMAKI